MKRVIILGSGFSHSIARLPLTKDMIDRFKEIIEEERKLKHNNRVFWGESIISFWNHLENEYLIKPHLRSKNTSKDSKIIESNYWTNFEAICSIIDLNLSTEVNARFEENGRTASLIGGKPMFWNFSTAQLQEVRSAIATYLYLALINDKSDSSLLDKFLKVFLNQNTAIITFNYDLILEKYLYNQKLWFPHDGYGFAIDNIPQIKPEFNLPSRIKILKLHGSLNWTVNSLLNDKFELQWVDDFQKSFFPNYLIEEPKNPFIYQGKHPSSAWILPSWIKQFEYPELLYIWRLASKALREADEIYVIGYSLPKEDTAIASLFGTIEYKCSKFLIIDPYAEDLAYKYRMITQIAAIECMNEKLENYLQEN